MVFVTKYRKKVINKDMLFSLKEVFLSVLKSWQGELIDFNGESDHVHLLVSYRPNKTLSNLIANLKATSSKAMWQKYSTHLAKYRYFKIF